MNSAQEEYLEFDQFRIQILGNDDLSCKLGCDEQSGENS